MHRGSSSVGIVGCDARPWPGTCAGTRWSQGLEAWGKALLETPGREDRRGYSTQKGPAQPREGDAGFKQKQVWERLCLCPLQRGRAIASVPCVVKENHTLY